MLDVPTDAAPGMIRDRYRQLRNLYEDDLGTYGLLDQEDREAYLAQVETAFAVLSDPERRDAYDRMLAEEGEPGPWYERPSAGRSGNRADRDPVPTGAPAGVRHDDVEEEREEIPEEGDAEEPTELPELPPGQRMNGAYMRAVREARGISPEAVSEVVKITSTQVENLEEHRFHRLPAPVYLKGFLRAYADVVGIDADRLVEDYLELRRIWEETDA